MREEFKPRNFPIRCNPSAALSGLDLLSIRPGGACRPNVNSPARSDSGSPAAPPPPTDCPHPACAHRTPPADRQAETSAYSDPSVPACACIRPRPNSRNSAHGPLSRSSPARPTGGGSNTSRIVGCSEKLGQVTCVDRCAPARIDDRRPVEIERHLPRRRIGADRRDVQPKARPGAAIGEERIADRRGALELGEVGGRHRRRCGIGRQQPPRLARRIDIAPQQRVHEAIERAAGREQPREVGERHIVGRSSARTGSGRSPPPGTARPGRRWRIEDRRQLQARIAAAQRDGARRDLGQPAAERLRLTRRVRLQREQRVDAAGRRCARRRCSTSVAASLAICCCASPTSRSTRSIGAAGPWPTRSRSAW